MTDHTTPEIEVDENQLLAERQKKLSLLVKQHYPLPQFLLDWHQDVH